MNKEGRLSRILKAVGKVALNSQIPRHIAIVMDGNGRWAEQQGLLRIEGHRKGVEAVKKTIQSCLKQKVEILSLFAFSSENWLRPAAEVQFLMDLFLEALHAEVAELHIHGICIHFVGDRTSLSSQLNQQMEEAECLTAGNTQLFLNIVINYGGKWDIMQAVKKLLTTIQHDELSVDAVDEAALASYLSLSYFPDPDLFIRTSGEQRISNFFLWQLAYTELYFTEINWPDFDETEFEKAIRNYQQRQRRYGKTRQQMTETSHV